MLSSDQVGRDDLAYTLAMKWQLAAWLADWLVDQMRIVYVLLSPTFGMHQYTADLANCMEDLSARSIVK